MLAAKLSKTELSYISLQIIIWAKCAIFFLLFGHGAVGVFNSGSFPQQAILLDYAFHTLAHIAIAILALVYGFLMKGFDILRLSKIVFIAVFLHNLGYWLTFSHPSALYSIADFGRDFLVLFIVIAAGFVLGKIQMLKDFTAKSPFPHRKPPALRRQPSVGLK
ncbi:MAG TPA: hypothetical protein VJH23_06345 [archaeon]|nr:hypothetical protein [archaeon]